MVKVVVGSIQLLRLDALSYMNVDFVVVIQSLFECRRRRVYWGRDWDWVLRNNRIFI